jgi:uncharacterized RDD family membrane protein YckC
MVAPPDALALPIDSQVHVETPENVWLSFRPAGPGPRMWAYFIDFCIGILIIIALAIVVSLLSPILQFSHAHQGILMLGIFGVQFFYYVLFEYFWDGRSPGKKVAKIRVIKVAGYPISFWDAFLRNLLRAADMLLPFYGVGVAVMLGTRRMQRLGDLVSGTFVVHEEREVVRGYPPWVHGVPPIPTSEMSHAYQPSERTLDLIETFLTRAQRLSRERADEIAHVLAGPLRDKLGYWDPGSEHLQSPGWFLLRVLRTFVYPPTESQPGHHVPLPSLPVPPPSSSPYGASWGGGPPPGASGQGPPAPPAAGAPPPPGSVAPPPGPPPGPPSPPPWGSQ